MRPSIDEHLQCTYLLYQLTSKQVWESRELMVLLVSGRTVPREAQLN